MILRFAKRMLTETDLRLLAKFSYNFGWKGMRAVSRFEKRRARGEFFPAFLFLSVTDRCNLSCQGCWSTPCDPAREMDLATLDRIVQACKSKGSYFFGILGGEPLLHKGLFELFEKHPECYFVLFTNGLLITDETAATMRRLGNVSPLVSIEGDEVVSDQRRGGRDVYARAMQGLEHCRRNRLITGVATSVCRSNMDALASERFLNALIEQGVHYAWYYIYRPVGPNPSPELALTPEQVIDLRRFIVDVRTRAPIMVVDAYWDHQGRALCPAAVGMAHHVGPGGDIEPCPPIQFARENIGDGDDIEQMLARSDFLAGFRDLACDATRGCIIMEDPERLREYMKQAGATDTSGRDAGLRELSAMTPRGSHHMPGEEIPEKSLLYRFAKKYWFFGFGAYG